MIAWAISAVAGVAIHGIYYRNSPLYGRVITRVSEGCVSLTFDDGPNPEATPTILDALAERGVKATFFVLGRHAQRWPELVARIARDGHQIGNHGFHHRKLHVKGPAYIEDDLSLGTEAIVDACGVTPRLFRAPHGFRNPWVTRVASALGQRTVGWSLGVWDSSKPGTNVIADRTVSGARSGSILLLHDGDGYDPAGDRSQTAAAVPAIVDRLVSRSLRFTTIPEA